MKKSLNIPLAEQIEFKNIYDTADNLAQGAVDDAISNGEIVPVTFVEHENMLDDNSPIKKTYFIQDGVCGFAWIKVRPANSRFAKWLIHSDLARKDEYYGGVNIIN
jgi:hypothetical protein